MCSKRLRTQSSCSCTTDVIVTGIFVVGKRESRPLKPTVAGKKKRNILRRKPKSKNKKKIAALRKEKKNTMRVWDRNTGLPFLIDCGADVCVLPASTSDKRCNPNTEELISADGSPIPTYGKRKLRLFLGHNRTFVQEFFLANVQEPILGADFFIENRLAIDLSGKRLISLDTLAVIPAKVSCIASTISGLRLASGNDFDKIIEDFPEILISRFAPTEPNKHGVELHINTKGPPTHARARRLDAEKLEIAKAEFAKMEELGIIRRSSSPWASPLHMVRKAGGGWRPCGDFRNLNNVTTDDRYPLPHIHDFNRNLKGMRIFSKIDLVRGYHQIPVAADDVAKTAVITPFGLWEFVRVPFGLKNAAQAFQRLMDGVLRDLPHVFVYLDDILVASKTPEEHRQHLREVFQLLSDNGLVINRAKCVFGVEELIYLGHMVNSTGIRPMKERVDAVLNFPAPKTKKDLQSFLGMINYYHRFMPGLASKLQPLHEATKTKDTLISWNEKCQAAFVAAKSSLSSAALLHHPDPSAPTSITTDASDKAVGGQLEQCFDGVWCPIAFFSRKLSKAEVNYSAFDRELLAIFLAIKSFRHYLEGRPFQIYTDHKPLTFAFTSTSERSPRQTRHLSFISEFSTDIHHIEGKHNVVADALSRATVSAVSLPTIDYKQLARDQSEEEIESYRTPNTGLSLMDIAFGDVTVICDVSTGQARPIIPKTWCRRVFDAVHGLAHPGPRVTQKIISAKFVWRGLKRDVREWCRDCDSCQTSKVHRHVKAPIIEQPLPDRRFGSIHLDIVGPLPISEGMRYLFTIVDRFTRWPEAIPMPDATATTCARVFIRHWISRFGVPGNLTSDRGPQFTSHLWKELNRLLGISSSTTTAYHPQANGMVERLHRQLKSSLKARMTGPNWMDELPLVLLGLRTAWREDPECSPADLVYGTSLHIPGEFLPLPEDSEVKPSSQFLQQLQQKMRNIFPPKPNFHGNNPSQSPNNLSSTGFVYVRCDAHRTPLQRPYSGPFKILEVHEKYFVLEINGRQDKISVDRMKVAYGAKEIIGNKK